MSINSFDDYPLSWRPDKRNLKRPFYLSLIKYMKNDIEAGNLLPGTKLPPQRELADFLDISFSTVTRAYKLSQDLGITYGIIGKGTYISQSAGRNTTITRNDIKSVKELGFISSFETNNSLLQPEIIASAKQTQISKLLNYDAPTGLPKHKLIAIKYLKKIGVKSNLDNLVITSGGENALVIALMGLFRSGDKIAVDQFTYANFIELAKLLNIKLVPIKSDGEGMSDKHLLQMCQSQVINGIYLMPDACNPTTKSISSKRRIELAKVIRAYRLIVIEDDYLSFLNLYREKPLEKISNLVPNQSVYICSMSKLLASGLRVAFMCTSQEFRSKIENAMFNISVKTSALDVDIVVRSLEDGVAEKIMNQKVKMAIEANRLFDKIFNLDNEYENQEKMLFFRFLPLQSTEKGEVLEKWFLRKGIRVFHSDRFLVGEGEGNSFLRISLASNNSLDDLNTGLLHLKRLLSEFEN